MPITLKQLDNLCSLVKSIDYVYVNIPNTAITPETIKSPIEIKDMGDVFYHWLLIGEILAKQEKQQPKLGDELRKLISEKGCERLQKIRDNFLAHSSVVVSVKDAEKDLIKAMDQDRKDLAAFRSLVFKIILQESIKFFQKKLEELFKLEDNKFAKTRNLVEDLKKSDNLSNYAYEQLKKLDENNHEDYKGQYEKSVNSLKDILNDINQDHKKDIDAKVTNNVDTLRKTPGFKDKKENLSKETDYFLEPLSLDDTLGSPDDFMRSFWHCVNQLQKRRTDNSQDKKNNLEEESNKLHEIMDKLKNCADMEESNHLRYKARWQLITICALFEELNLQFTSEFKGLRNNAIHASEKIDPKKEVDDIIRELDALPIKRDERMPQADILAKRTNPDDGKEEDFSKQGKRLSLNLKKH